MSLFATLTYVFWVRWDRRPRAGRLPHFPRPQARDAVCLVLGEVHHPTKPEPSATPSWLVIPERGLFTGIAIVGAIGTGKTSGCMYPYADQLLGYRAQDPHERISGLVLEVKGDFCHQLRGLMRQHGRADDYIEISLDAPYRYNPLHNDLDAYALAYGIASLLNNLFGRSEEPFWQQAYTNLVKFIILLHKVVDGYVTLFDVYESAINPDRIAEKLAQGERQLSESGVAVSVAAADIERVPAIRRLPWVLDTMTGRMLTELSPELEQRLNDHKIATLVETSSEPPGRRSTDDGSISSRPSSAGFNTTGCASNRSCGRRSSRASPCSSRCSTTTRPSSTRSVRPRRATTRWPTPTGASASRCRRSPT